MKMIKDTVEIKKIVELAQTNINTMNLRKIKKSEINHYAPEEDNKF